MLPWEVANINPEKHSILVFLSNTLFLLFTSLLPPFPQYQKMGGTWEELGRNMGGTFSFHLRYFFAFQSIPKRSPIEDKAKFYRRPIEHLSKTYRRPIEHLSKTYRRPIEEGVKRERTGSREGAEEEFGYKVTKFRSLIFTFLVVSVTFWHFLALFGRQCHLMALFGLQFHLMSLFSSSCSSPMLRLDACTTLSKE